MTHPSREYEDRLRRALRAAADSVEPSPDGLGRIRARLTPPRPVVAAWMVTETEPSMLRLRSLLNSLRLRIGRPRGQFRPAPAGTGAARHKLRTQQSWLRPVAVAAAFVVILGSGAFAISKLMQTSGSSGAFRFGRRRGVQCHQPGRRRRRGQRWRQRAVSRQWLAGQQLARRPWGFPGPAATSRERQEPVAVS